MINNNPQWFVLRATYGREKKAYEYIVKMGGNAYCPTAFYNHFNKNGILMIKEKSLLPNILFIYATEDEAKSYVYDNYNLPFLRFYYNRYNGIKKPLIIPEYQMDNLKIICDSKEQDKTIVMESTQKFKCGQLVRVVGGPFKGFTGIVARWKGQQRVGIYIEGLGTFATTYIANYYLEYIN